MSGITIIIPSLKKGGAEKQACLLAKVLKDKYDVSMIVLNPEAGFEDENIELSGLDRNQIYTLVGGRFTQIRGIYKLLRRNTPKYLFCYLTRPDVFGPIIGKLTGVKYIYQGIRNAKLPFIKILLEWFGNRFSTGVIINNYAGVKMFKHCGIKNIIVIPNCYNAPMPPQVHEQNDSYVTVVMVARFVKQKDYPTAIKSMARAIRQNKNLKFKIIGHGHLETHIRELIHSNEISENTEILINPSNVMQHLLESDIYISTSLFEGTSNSIMEALDASLPVVATNVGDNDKLIINGVNGYLTATRQVDLISEHILELSYSKALRYKFGIEGNRLLRKEYSFEIFKKRYIDLISSK